MPKHWGKVQINLPHSHGDTESQAFTKEAVVSATAALDPRPFMVLTSNERAREVIKHVNAGHPDATVECESEGAHATALYTSNKDVFITMQGVLKRMPKLPCIQSVKGVQQQGTLVPPPTKAMT